MVMIILYMFWSTTKGIISIGIRFLWVNLYRFRRAATQPQGLLAATMLLMLSLAGLSYSLTMSVAPDYSMFGSQKYVGRGHFFSFLFFLTSLFGIRMLVNTWFLYCV
jgi:LMBR1 domain-containing protein 1